MYSSTPGSGPASFGANATLTPPRSGNASSGIFTAISNGRSSWVSVAWKVRTGIAAITCCDTLSRSATALPDAVISDAVTSQRKALVFTGTVASQPMSRASPAASVIREAGSAWPSTFPFTSTSMTRSEALRTVKRASKRSPSRTSGGTPESSIRSCVARIEVSPVPNNPLPESATAMMRNDVSESLSGMSTAAPLRQGLAAVVALADHLHGRRRGIHLDSARPHHRVQQFPGIVGQQLEQAFVDRGDRHFAGPDRHRLSSGALRHLHGDARLLAYLVRRSAGADVHAQFVRPPADADLHHTHPESRLAKVHQCRRLQVRNAPAHHQYRHEYIRCVIAPDRHFHHRRGSRERLHERFNHALALDRDERGGSLERHAHLQLRGLARFVALALGNHVDAVVVALVEPPRVLARDPGRAVGVSDVAVAILRFRRHQDVAGHWRFHRAEQPPAVVGLAGAGHIELLHLGAALVSVEAAHQAFPVGE